MPKLSRTQRKIIGETVRQIVANLGLAAPVKHNGHDNRPGHTQSEHDPKQTPPKNLFDIVSELLTVGVSGLLFAFFCGGIINWCGQFPQILNFGAWGISVLLIFGAYKMVCFHGRHWAVISIAIIAAAVICIPTWNLVEDRKKEAAFAKSEILKERNIIADTPGRFDRVDAALSNIPNSSLNLPEYIKGTRITHEQLSEFFPFGYAVFYFDKTERLIHEVFKTGYWEWQIDWDKVKIEPNISAGTVHWTLPSVSINGISNSNRVNNNSIAEDSLFKKGIKPLGGFGRRNQPSIYGATLSDDQRNPIFAVGMKIPSPSITNDLQQLFLHYQPDGQQ